MQRELVVKGLGLGGTSDLTLMAPLRQGLVDSLETMTYKTRVKRVLAALHGARQSSHEWALARLLSDAVERVAVIHSVRVVVMEPEDQVMLAVTFDGPWESYIRVLWDKVGALLDLIFFNTEDYTLASTHAFEEWATWVRRVQRETGFFYGPPAGTAIDVLFDRRLQRMRERRPELGSALDELQATQPNAEEVVRRLTAPQVYPRPEDPPLQRPDMFRMAAERLRQYLPGLAAVYRLAELHLADEDAAVLRRAGIELLREFIVLRNSGIVDDDLAQQRERFARALDWMFPNGPARVPVERPRRPLPPEQQLEIALRRDVQGGILNAYDGVTHGVLLLFSFDDASAAAAFLRHWVPRVTADDPPPDVAKAGLLVNLAFTPAGLRAAGVEEDTLFQLPEEFLQGMARRAGALGDVRHNHPRRWRLPPQGDGLVAPAADADVIDLNAVHAVLQLRIKATEGAALKTHDLSQDGHPLQGAVKEAAAVHAGARLLAVQSMRRRYRKVANVDTIVEHFGFADGNGQPDLEWQGAVRPGNRVALGEVLCGHANSSSQAPPDAGVLRDAAQQAARASEHDRAALLHARAAAQALLHNGSFLVLRKYRQFPARLGRAVGHTAWQLREWLGLGPLHPDHLAALGELTYAKLMGRDRNGRPLADVGVKDPNDFDFADDPRGERCPLHAHVRRAHPRRAAQGGERPPRIVRRGMAYGPDDSAGPDADRGLVFMAYNQSLAEQFEHVQRWLVGGNSTGASSATSCPILGVPEQGQPRHFRFEVGFGDLVTFAPDLRGVIDEQLRPRVFDTEIEQETMLFDDAKVVTQLDWGLYLLTPSLAALRQLAEARPEPRLDPRATPWESALELAQARQLLKRLRQVQPVDETEAAAAPAQPTPAQAAQRERAIEAWKSALEDPGVIDRQRAAALWALIRKEEGGLLVTPYGAVVADRDLLLQVLKDPGRCYSVSGQMQRMASTFGELYLGLDDGPQYRAESQDMNQAIGQLDADEVFGIARDAVTRKIDAIKALAIRNAKTGEQRYDTVFDARELLDDVLGDLSEHWFGVQDGARGLLERGSPDLAWDAARDLPLYPGHYTALSRNMFQPHPGAAPTRLATAYGQSLRRNMRRFVERHVAAGTVPRRPESSDPAPLAAAAFAQWRPPKKGEPVRDEDFVGRLINGVLMGFTPTIIGAVANVLYEWRRDDRFGAVRSALRTAQAEAERQAARDGRRVPPGQPVTAGTASRVLYRAMNHAAQIRPMPQITWRTVTRDHTLQRTDGRIVTLRAGAIVALGLLSGTHQSLADGAGDGRLMFGGVRGPADAPTHACPGWEAGRAAMLGSLAGLLARAEDLREGPSPLSYAIEGPLPPPPPEADRPLGPAGEPGPLPAEPDLPAARDIVVPAKDSRHGVVLAWGDSWVAYEGRLPDGQVVAQGTDLRDCLAHFGYVLPAEFCNFSVWGTTRALAAAPEEFCEALARSITPNRRPRAVLLSAGGNDSTRAALSSLLNEKAPGRPVLDVHAVRDHVARIEARYIQVLDAIDAVLRAEAPHADGLRVLVHGYDHPSPRGRGREQAPIRGEWLFDPFVRKGYDVGPAGTDAPHAANAMAWLINRLNEMLSRLDRRYPFVTHVDLRGVIARHAGAEDGWNDDLHPTNAMFMRLAAHIDAVLETLAPNP